MEGEYKIHVSEVMVNGVPYVRIHIVDPDGKDGRWMHLTPAAALSTGTHIVEIAEKHLSPPKEKPTDEGT